MKTHEAIAAFSQSEKIKSGLLWLSQCLEMQNSFPEPERRGAEKTVRALLSMIGNEVRIAGRFAADPSWENAEKHLDLALVMMNSGAPQEAVYHLTRAVSQVTVIGQRSLSFLKNTGLF